MCMYVLILFVDCVYVYVCVLILFGGRHERKYVGMPDGSVAGDV